MTLMAEKGNIYAQCYLAFHLRKINRFEEAADWYCRAIGNGEINTFTFYPRMLTEKLSDTQKNYLKGVFLLADHFDDTNMQYVAEFMLSRYIFPENEERLSYYRNRLLDKKYPKFIFRTLCQRLIYSKLSEEQKNKWLIGWSSNEGGTFSNFDEYEKFDKGTPEKTVKYIKKKLL